VQLAVALQWILEHPQAAREMADAARTLLGVTDRYTPAHLGAVLADCYDAAQRH
jgi:hypothetical protein